MKTFSMEQRVYRVMVLKTFLLHATGTVPRNSEKQCICSAYFSNTRSFEIVQHNL